MQFARCCVPESSAAVQANLVTELKLAGRPLSADARGSLVTHLLTRRTCPSLRLQLAMNGNLYSSPSQIAASIGTSGLQVVHQRGQATPTICTCTHRPNSTRQLDSLDEEDWDRAEAILRGEPWPPGPADAPRRSATPPDAGSPRRSHLPDDREQVYPPWRAADGISLQYDQPQSASEHAQHGWLASLRGKLRAAWAILFGKSGAAAQSSSRRAGLNRLKVVLVADRVGMTPASFSEMKRDIVSAYALPLSKCHRSILLTRMQWLLMQ